MTMVDLREICKEKRWRYNYDESFRAECMSVNNVYAPYYVQIQCRNGLIYPYNGSYLLVCVEGHNYTATKLKAELGESLVSHQGNVVFRFALSDLDRVASIVKPKRLPGRKLTEEERDRLISMGFKGNKYKEEGV